MNYSVDWEDETYSQLAAWWIMQVPFRQAITSAQARIDQLLSSNPFGNSEPLSEGLFAIEVHPLRVLFEISETDQLVTVVSVSFLL